MLLLDGRFPAGGHAHSGRRRGSRRASATSSTSPRCERSCTAARHDRPRRRRVRGRARAPDAADLQPIAGELDARVPARVDVAVPRARTSRRLGRQLLRARRPRLAERRRSPRSRRRTAGRTSRSRSARWSAAAGGSPADAGRARRVTTSVLRSRRPPSDCSASTRSTWRRCRPALARVVDAGRHDRASMVDRLAVGSARDRRLAHRDPRRAPRGLDARLFIA